MAKLLHTMTQNCSVGIYDNCTRIARVYEDRTVVTNPEVKWVGNTGGYHEGKYRIDGKAHEKIVACMEDECEDSAWNLIMQNL